MNPILRARLHRDRRAVLRGLAGLPLLALAGARIDPAWADSPAASGDFSAVSTALTGHASFDPPLLNALYAAFGAQDAQFDERLGRLALLLRGTPADALKPVLVGKNADLVTLPADLLTGWYLGIVGKGEHSVCVAYASNLSNRLVADVLRPPSYAYGAYGSWSHKPV